VLTQNVYSVGTATQTVVAPTNDLVTYQLRNLQPSASGEAYARDGYVYLYGNTFSVTSGSTAAFSFLTGETGAQIEFYEIATTTSDISAELVEGATIVTNGDPIAGYNLNRNFSDAHESVLKAATVTGGTVVSREFLSATNQGGSNMTLDKVHTLEPNTEYGFRFIGVGSQTTTVFFQIGWTERYNGYHDIWLETVSDSYVLRGGEEVKFNLLPNEIINATALVDSCRLAVMRQE
jgi:hypothetical protein